MSVSAGEGKQEDAPQLEVSGADDDFEDDEWPSDDDDGDWDMDALEINTEEPPLEAVARVLSPKFDDGEEKSERGSERELDQVEGARFDLHSLLLAHSLVSDKRLRAADSQPAWVCFDCGFVNRLIEDFDCRRRSCRQRRPDDVKVYFGSVDDPNADPFDAFFRDATDIPLVWACDCGTLNDVDKKTNCRKCDRKKMDDCVLFQGGDDTKEVAAFHFSHYQIAGLWLTAELLKVHSDTACDCASLRRSHIVETHEADVSRLPNGKSAFGVWNCAQCLAVNWKSATACVFCLLPNDSESNCHYLALRPPTAQPLPAIGELKKYHSATCEWVQSAIKAQSEYKCTIAHRGVLQWSSAYPPTIDKSVLSSEELETHREFVAIFGYSLSKSKWHLPKANPRVWSAANIKRRTLLSDKSGLMSLSPRSFAFDQKTGIFGMCLKQKTAMFSSLTADSCEDLSEAIPIDFNEADAEYIKRVRFHNGCVIVMVDSRGLGTDVRRLRKPFMGFMEYVVHGTVFVEKSIDFILGAMTDRANTSVDFDFDDDYVFTLDRENVEFCVWKRPQRSGGWTEPPLHVISLRKVTRGEELVAFRMIRADDDCKEIGARRSHNGWLYVTTSIGTLYAFHLSATVSGQMLRPLSGLPMDAPFAVSTQFGAFAGDLQQSSRNVDDFTSLISVPKISICALEYDENWGISGRLIVAGTVEDNFEIWSLFCGDDLEALREAVCDHCATHDVKSAIVIHAYQFLYGEGTVKDEMEAMRQRTAHGSEDIKDVDDTEAARHIVTKSELPTEEEIKDSDDTEATGIQDTETEEARDCGSVASHSAYEVKATTEQCSDDQMVALCLSEE